jgi:arsenate reductase (glutaredoxin)
MILYGIPNCDTVKKARKWLDAAGVAYAFHDYKKAGVDEAALSDWVEEAGWEALLNKRGTTFRTLSDDDKADIDAAKAIRLMVANPSLIKRPVVAGAKKDGAALLIGFSEADYATRFGA